MKAQFKLLVFGAAFGAAIAANAQGAEPSGAAPPVIPDPNPVIMPSGNAAPSGDAAAQAAKPTGNAIASPSRQDRAPANRQNDVIRACSEVPAADVESCIARENARKQSGTPSTGHTTGKSKGSTSSDGAPSSTSNSTAPSGTRTGSSTSSMRSAGEDSANAEGTTKK